MDKKVRSIEISKRVTIVGNYDVVVCGGGPDVHRVQEGGR